MMTEDELRRVKFTTGLFNHSTLAWLYGFILERSVSVEEVDDAHSRLWDEYYREHPDEKGVTFADIEREPNITFWRSQV